MFNVVLNKLYLLCNTRDDHVMPLIIVKPDVNGFGFDASI